MQAFVDPATKEVRGPGADLARELGKRAGVPVTVTGARGVDGVIEAVKNGSADIGFVAFDPVRAEHVDFSQNYSLAQNTYLVTENSPIKSIADVDRAGIRIGVGARDAGDYFLTRTLKAATLVRNDGGVGDTVVKALLAGELDAYASNRMRLHEAAKKTPGLRLVPDNFYGVEQAVIVPKGETARLAIINRFIDEARASGFIADSIARVRTSSVLTSRRRARAPQNESGTVPKHDPATLLPTTRGGDDCASQDAHALRHARLRRASYECLMCGTAIKLWS